MSNSRAHHLLHCTCHAPLSFSRRICKSRYTTNRRKPRTHFRLVLSIHNLHFIFSQLRILEHSIEIQHYLFSKFILLYVISEPSFYFYQTFVIIKKKDFWCIPGGVPQHKLRSSICSTSNPINHAPKDTSSFAYRCKIGLKYVNVH